MPTTESVLLLATEAITDEVAATLAAGFEALVELLTALDRLETKSRHGTNGHMDSG